MSTENLALALCKAAESTVARRVHERIVLHLADRLERDLRQGLAMRPPSSEEVALGIIKGVAHELRAASTALLNAAETLKATGKGHQASQAHQAALRALKAAEELIGA